VVLVARLLTPMADGDLAGRCLNCHGPLTGPFCASCGQRAVPPNPTIAELTGDAWQELSGYDGRILATVRGLLRPGHLTLEYIAGRRAHYLPPLRVYLAVSVLYFVLAAAAPEVGQGTVASVNAGGVRIGVAGSQPAEALSADDRAALLAQLDEAPYLLRPMLRSVLDDPAGFRSRVFTTMPRVLFAMLPVFAAIVSLFYRGRHFPVSLVFAAHLHAFAFVAIGVAELAKFARMEAVAVTVSALALVSLTAYVLLAFRRVYGGGWLAIIVKGAAIGIVYALASIPFFMLMLAMVAR
jgi:hypothetical protein